MDLSFLGGYIVPSIVAVCLCVGYIIKNSLDFIPNKYIPLILSLVGLGLSILIGKNVSIDIILGGIFSGLSSTGLYEAFKNILIKEV